MNIIIGNITSFIANMLDAYSSTRKTKKSILTVQCFSCLVYTVTNLLFNAYSTVAANICALLRNILAVFEIKIKVLDYFIIVASLFLGVYFNNQGLLGLIPVFGNLEYTICLFALKDNVRGIKYSFLVCNICFLILNFFIKNYVGTVFTLITVITEIIDLLKK